MMHSFQLEGKRAVLDIRERIAKGEHPRREILNFIHSAPIGTLFEIHLPHRGEPLIANLQSLGMNVIANEIEPMHFRLMAVKLNEF
ncbi:amino acid decarboxylase [Neobacillus pocheonensis]|uniref:Amino acid decarboxylase n=1 Tax=Neobacillus pocheonensis TaxID=363869 RepID=A0ABT0WD22_9BACI|nr:amino acid decarboxylase [Neobacillus pocheonensis]